MIQIQLPSELSPVNMDFNNNDDFQVYSVSRNVPSFRNSSKSARTWLGSKRHDDSAEGLWRIHDELFDLINFIPKHPGGVDWLLMTQGTDITELFETHHISGKARLLLSNFYVRDADKPRNSRITFSEDGFYQSLKLKLADYLTAVNRSETKRFSDVKHSPHSMFTVAVNVKCNILSDEKLLNKTFFHFRRQLTFCLLRRSC